MAEFSPSERPSEQAAGSPREAPAGGPAQRGRRRNALVSGLANLLVPLTSIRATSPRSDALAEAYRPIMRGVLLPGAAYYAFVTWGHWQDETGIALMILGGMSVITAALYYFMGQHVVTRHVSLLRMELVGLTTNLLMYLNVVVYLLINFEQHKILYFALMAVVFSATGITLRTTLLTISLAVVTLYAFALGADEELRYQLMFIGVATAFVAFGMASLLRRAVVRQIDARLLADELALKAQDLSRTDPLTGLANRRAVFQRMDSLIAERRPYWMGVLDLDNFKSVNDLYGHVVGDTLLRLAVQRLVTLDVPGFTVGRMGGDEFVLIVEGSLTSGQVEELGNRAIAAVSAPYAVGMMQLDVGASAGFAYVPAFGASSTEAYERADFALYKAKARRRGSAVVFDAGEELEMQEINSLEKALRGASIEDEMSLLFQPQFSLKRNQVVGLEALARWHSPTLGAVPPDKFIRAAERAGLIQRVTAVLFRRALDTMLEWPDDVSMAFNLSALDICDRDFIMSLCECVRERGIRPDRIEFEITETAVMSEPERSCAVLAEVASLGFRIALDDFGSGYSSFQYIDELPLHKVKVDRSFVRKVPNSIRSREIIAAVIGLCNRLGLDSVLEGVETEAELAVLAPLQPQIIQGYLYGKPMPAESVRALLAARAVA